MTILLQQNRPELFIKAYPFCCSTPDIEISLTQNHELNYVLVSNMQMMEFHEQSSSSK